MALYIQYCGGGSLMIIIGHKLHLFLIKRKKNILKLAPITFKSRSENIAWIPRKNKFSIISSQCSQDKQKSILEFLSETLPVLIAWKIREERKLSLAERFLSVLKRSWGKQAGPYLGFNNYESILLWQRASHEQRRLDSRYASNAILFFQ